MDQIKEAFRKVKEDMDSLKEELNSLKMQLRDLRISLDKPILYENKPAINPANPPLNPTYSNLIPTHNPPFNPLKPLISGISSGNEGVPTDKQTNQQTNQQIDKSSYNQEEVSKKDSILDAVKILDSLDNLKKEIRLKFKRLTDQEMVVFSSIYQGCEEEGFTDYKTLSQKLKLTESSIRDYVGRIIKKGVPVEKIKVNNKNIQLIISPNLKKITSLSTILQLREL